LAATTSLQEQQEHLVAFQLAGELYGIPIRLVHEIIRPCEITRIPRSPHYVLGVINLRGKIIPVVDLRLRLDLPREEASRATRIIVVNAEQGVVGMRVDAVTEVLRLSESRIEYPSEFVADVEADFIRGVGKHENGLVILLDVEKVLNIPHRTD
jgi:purine-binding chemotaxis protein CheW